MGKDKIKAKDVAPCFAGKDLNELNLVRCPSCGGVHMRQAGNVLTYRKYDYQSKRHMGEVDTTSHLVFICIGCGKPWVSVNDDLFDASEEIDVEKFDKVNKALEQDTGTNPHC